MRKVTKKAAPAKKASKKAPAKKKTPAKKKAPAKQTSREKAPAKRSSKERAPAKKVPARKRAPGSTKAAGDRHDVYVSNDSGGFSVMPGSAVPRVIAYARANHTAIVAEQQAMLLLLQGDDSFPLRVVVGGALTEDEEAEWMARATGRLDLSCGRLVAAGGFDPDVLADWQEGRGNFTSGVHAFDVPPGTYLVDVYTHRPTISGRFLEESWPKPLGTWFREEHPGAPYPAWLAAELRLSPELDPGHEDLWSDVAASIASGAVRLDPQRRAAIGYLVHLRPDDPAAEVEPPGDWIDAETGARVPARCPRGLTTAVDDPEVTGFLRDVAPTPEQLAADRAEREASAKARDSFELGEPIDVAARVADLPLEPVAGGPVELPLRRLHEAYLLAWLSTEWAHPEVLVTCDEEAPTSEHWVVVPRDGGWSYRLGITRSRFAPQRLLEQLSQALTALPDGAEAELVTAPSEPDALEDDEVERGVGALRLRGHARGGVWLIDAAAPSVDAATLREGLAYCAGVAGGREVRLRDAAQAAAFDSEVADWSLVSRDEPVVVDGLVRRLTTPNREGLANVSGRGFRAGFGDTWPGESDDD